ncbi:MAG TPA: hypothetical protein VKD72_22735, partial [Gemmataceae bacterium]|nr:hypothetical protein [Gemmataceae bacterium]
MDLCAALAVIAFVGFFIAVLGHGLWMLAAGIVKSVFGDGQAGPATGGVSRAREVCVRCGTPFPARETHCPGCGLDPHGRLAGQLKDLEITAANVQSLVESGALERAAGEQVYRSLEARQTALLEGLTWPA